MGIMCRKAFEVSKEDYETCTLSSDARELGRCISPMKKDKVKVSFRLLSPNPSALDYLPGQIYYFITTSTGTPWGLDNHKGGLCSSHQLKMIIHVGDYVYHRRHHKKLVTTTATTFFRISHKPLGQETNWLTADPLWNQIFEKFEKVGNSVWSTVTRGGRLALDEENRRHEYESAQPHGDIDFQIHEIGEGSMGSRLLNSRPEVAPKKIYAIAIE
uniref:Ephrin RBD domain-containing protein n=1 Tax=Angiostrongylus cantonensis TaxID=6313 RepID=A0A0K0DPD3_ANGCA